ncbi:hypothetical protein DESUT3_20590 [Desulfuromonas versatilis]|uniref:Uncharacterized protein n=1 Tax=Desulfuromonas versatilis TaxID=2802975 RepID=A0ABM8HSV5_9BACT|nr:hypothetical protein [Desulfuromonas versatilis]BCR04990.1 hypothetical protein DESUT3_20590 [Desulfuromonas versatilis]
MAKDCELIDHCCFFNKFKNRQSIAWQGIFRIYCLGGLPFLCERRRFHFESGQQPSENIMPTGKLVSRGFAALP